MGRRENGPRGLIDLNYLVLLVVVVVVSALIFAFMNARPPKIECNDPYDHSCCVNIRDPCGSKLSCPDNTCDTPECRNKCGNSTGCVWVGTNVHSCISIECASDYRTCTPDECLAYPYRYNPETGKSMDGNDWWHYVTPGGSCCRITASGEKEC